MKTLKFTTAASFDSTQSPVAEYREDAPMIPRIGESVEFYGKRYLVRNVHYKPLFNSVEFLLKEI